MSSTNITNKWTAVVLSFVVPGAGHLWLGNGFCVAWFSLTAIMLVVLQNIFPISTLCPGMVKFFSFLCLGLLSAIHAENCFESQEGKYIHPGIRSKVICRASDSNKVYARIEMEVPMLKDRLWEIISHLEQFLCVDPFHSRIVIKGATAPGTDIVLEHQVLGFRFLRFGRILSWMEGRGYAFSDLSAQGKQSGFPHVFFIDIASSPEKEAIPQSKLSITVKGKWTVQWIPHVLRHWWLNMVCREHALLLMKGLSFEQ